MLNPFIEFVKANITTPRDGIIADIDKIMSAIEEKQIKNTVFQMEGCVFYVERKLYEEK